MLYIGSIIDTLKHRYLVFQKVAIIINISVYMVYFCQQLLHLIYLHQIRAEKV